MRRVNVTGTSASGKTTLARALAARLAVPVVELDALHWGPGWTQVDDTTMHARVERAVAAEAWVVDGNYAALRHLVWERVDTVVWLDFTLPAILRRFASRTARRIRSGEELWPGTGNVRRCDST